MPRQRIRFHYASWFLACLLFMAAVCGPAPGRAQDALTPDCLDQQYRQALQRLADLANQALPYVDRADALAKKIKSQDDSPGQRLSPEDQAEFQRISQALHTLYARNEAESAYARDLKLLSGLYQASQLIHTERAGYIERTGTAQGFEHYLATQVPMDEETYFYLQLLNKLQSQAPADPEAGLHGLNSEPAR